MPDQYGNPTEAELRGQAPAGPVAYSSYDDALRAAIAAIHAAQPQRDNSAGAKSFQPQNPSDPYYQRSDIAPVIQATNRDVMGGGAFGYRRWLRDHPVGTIAAFTALAAGGAALSGGLGGGAAGGTAAGSGTGGAAGVGTGLVEATPAVPGAAATATAGNAAAGTGLGVFSNGGVAGMAGVGGGSAGTLAASGALGGGAAIGGTTGAISGLGLGGAGANMAWTDWIGPALSAGASIIGSRQASNAVSSAESRAIAEAERQFDLTRADTAPQRQLGADAIARLSRLYGYGGPGQITATAPGTTPNLTSAGARIAGRVLGTPPVTYDNATGQPVGASGSGSPDMSAFFESPDYQFNLAEGQKAIDRSAAARGGLLSGAATKEGVRYASGSASREYGAFVDRLMQQAGLGSNGTAQSAAAGANAANNIGSAAINAGNTRASIYGQNAANISNAVQGGISNSILQRYLGQGG